MRVLVVEDDRQLAGSIGRGLEAEGFAVDVVFDGRTGLARPSPQAADASQRRRSRVPINGG